MINAVLLIPLVPPDRPLAALEEQPMRRARSRPNAANASQNARQSRVKESGARDRHARELLRIAGLPAVSALFARDPDRVERLFFTSELQREAAAFTADLARARRPYRLVQGD
ncbi:MAG: hypothetical protein FJX57_21910, partial [Alphaproteobacteria bacterium]|nr:hypothetical protein [Alphaproteobacteria bacterium]